MTIAQWFLALGAFFALGLVLFALAEKRGIAWEARAGYSSRSPVSLSYAIWYVGHHFPLSLVAGGLFLGLMIGGLSVHFVWNWCPPGSTSIGSVAMFILGG